MRGAQTICRGLLTLIALGTMLTGCATFGNKDISFGSRIGLRPDDAHINVMRTDTCEELNAYVKYAVDLKEAYRTRATQNRSWLYIAGITGLGVAAASGGLAAAGAAAAGTLGLLAISGGFTAGAFATINNAELANVYTVAANDIGTALTNIQFRIRCSRSQEECGAELAYLSSRVTSARNTLETARTDTAAGAMARAAAAKKLLDDEIAKVQEQVEKEKEKKEASDKKAEAAAAQADSDTKQRDADAVKKMAKTIDQSDASQPDKDSALREATTAQRNADEAKKKAADAKKAAEEAEAKADTAALAAATSPVTPSCLPAKVPGKVLSFTPATVMFDGQDKPLPVVAEIQDVDLRNISNENLSIDIGGKTVPIDAKVQKGLDSPHDWTIRFVPPDKRLKDDESEHSLSLLYGKEPLATAQTRIKYPKR